MAGRSPRNIVILCDGTGKNGEFESRKGEPITNIWRLYKAIRPLEGDVVKYFPGVGADNPKVTVMDLLARTFGHTAVCSIRKIYMTIAHHYKDGDSISLFGYSRGAFIVRKVASLIGALGLIKDETEFNKYWKSMEHKLPGKRSTPRPRNPRVVPISCIGVWDTVGAVRPLVIRETLNLLTLPDDDLPEIVQSALHVVAYHENRKLFDVALFDDKHSNRNQLCKQTLFPGCHSDVGGGGDKPKAGKNILPDVTLDWMLRNMPSTIRVALGEKLESEVPSWYQLNSAFHDGPFWKRIPDKLFRREYLTTISGLLRHRTLLGLPSPNSPHLLWHDWELVDYPEEEVENVMPVAKPSIVGRLVAKVKSSITSAPQGYTSVPSPLLPPRISPAAKPQVLTLGRPPNLQAYSPSSATTEQTNFTTDTQETISTPRTSLFSLDLAPEPRGEWEDQGPLADVQERPAFLSPAPKPILLPPQLPPRRVPSPTPAPPPLPPRKNEAANVSHDPVPFPTLPPLPPRRPGVPIIEVEAPEETAGTSYLAKPPTRARPASVSYRQPKKSIIKEIKHYLETKF